MNYTRDNRYHRGASTEALIAAEVEYLRYIADNPDSDLAPILRDTAMSVRAELAFRDEDALLTA